MKSVSSVVVFIILFVFSFPSFSQQIAFPGAEGYGKFASGGRGNGTNGRVAVVTNLDDELISPPAGSFRWALQQGTEVVTDPILGNYTVTRPLTIVFKVGGVINLKGELRVTRSNLTIAGQTAPGDGICIRGATVNLSGSANVIVRYLRFRPGDELGIETSAFRIENGGNFIIDHCSMSWAIEETTHFSSNENTTVQWCIISESLYNSIHKKGARGYATQWGGEYASYHHNLLAHHNSRMPRINGSNANDLESLVDYRNNVNYNWGSTGAFYGGEWEATSGKGFCRTNVVNNYFIPGPATPTNPVFAQPSYNRSGVKVDGYAKWYFNGNTMVGNNEKTADNWLGVNGSEVGGIQNIKSETEFVKSDGKTEAYSRYTETALQAFQSVLKNAGAVLPQRDTIDKRIISEIKGQTKIVRFPFTTSDGQLTPVKGINSGIIDTQKNLVSSGAPEGITAWSVYNSTFNSPVDSDIDGIPDNWEKLNGLNQNDITDGRKIAANGYSNLENYLNSMDLFLTSSSFEKENKFKIYPNPTKENLIIETESEISKIEIFDVTGKKQLAVNTLSNRYYLSLNGLGSGIYIVKVSFTDNTFFNRKFIIQI